MKNYKILLFVVAIATLNFSCIVDDSTGDDQLNAFGESSYVLGFDSTIANISYFEDLGAITQVFPVSILGGMDGNPAGQDFTVNYSIDPASTAVEGAEFDFISDLGTLVIPAGDQFVDIPLSINTGNFDPEVPTTLILTLTQTTGNAVISTISDTLTITFVGCQSQVNTFTYDVETKRVSTGALVAIQTESIAMESVNVFRTQTVGPYGPGNTANGSIGGTEGYTFSDVCGTITVESQNLVSLYSNQVFGSGTVDPVTGDIVITYTITFASGDSLFESTYIKQ